MKRRQKFMPLALALAMALSLAVPAFASEIDAPGGGNSEAVLTQEQTSFSVTVPTGLPVDIASDGAITVAADAEIRNNGFGPVEVSAVSVVPQNGWTLVGFGTDFTTKKVGLHEFGFQLQGNNVGTDGSCATTGFPVIPGNSAVPLSYDANVAAQKNAASNEVMANVVFTINWAAASDPSATPTGISIAANPSKTQYEVGENFDTAGMQIQVTFQDGHTETIPSGFMVTDGSDLQAGRTSVTVSYTGAGVTQTCTVPISMAKGYDIVDPVNPGADSFELDVGETLQLDAVATFDMAPASWASNNTGAATVSDTGLVTGVGEGVATITYTRGDMSSTTEITVRDLAKIMTGISVAKAPIKTQYEIGEDFNSTGMEILVTYKDGHTKTVTGGFTVTNWENLQKDRTSVTVSFSENGVTKTCRVPIVMNYVHDFTVTKDNRSEIGYTGAAGENLVIPATFKGTDGINYKVVAIGDMAFYNCTSLTSVTIPDSVTSIGYKAFYECTSLREITVGGNNPSYCSVDGVLFNKDKTTLVCYPGGRTDSYEIPNGVTSIAGYAFYNCPNLTSVTIPDSVTSIGSEAFNSCLSLKEITVDKNNPNYCSVDGVLFNKDKTTLICCPGGRTDSYEIPNGVTSIAGYAFFSCDKLTSVTISNSVTSIGGYAFYGCDKLTSVTIPNSVTSIGGYAFHGCYKLTSVTIPNSVTSIGRVAFAYCTELTSVTIPDSVTSIGDHAFVCCGELTSVTISNSVTSIGEEAFSCCDELTSVTIPNSVTSIERRTFSGCYKLTSVTIPNSVTSVGDEAFFDVPHITYHGTATGAPWGAKSMN